MILMTIIIIFVFIIISFLIIYGVSYSRRTDFTEEARRWKKERNGGDAGEIRMWQSEVTAA